MINGINMKNQHGFGALDVFLLLLFFGVLIYNLVYVPHHNAQLINELRSEPPLVTVAYKQKIDNFRNKATPKFAPQGMYYTEGEIDGEEYTITYYFQDNQSVTIEMTVLSDEYRLGGTANYHFEGSVLVFSEINGDRYLFPLSGVAISMPNENLIVQHGTLYPITLKSSKLIDLEKKEAELAEAERKVRLNATPILDLSLEEAIEKAVNHYYFPLASFFLIVPIALMFLLSIYRTFQRGY